MDQPILDVFHQDALRVYAAGRSHRSRFGHTFASDVSYRGLQTPGAPSLFVVARLHCDDPIVGVHLSTSRWLPLLAAVPAFATDLGYRVVSDTEVQLLHVPSREEWEGEDFEPISPMPCPLEFFGELQYTAENPDSITRYAGIFGFDSVTPSQYRALVEDIRSKPWHLEEPEFYLEEMSGPYLQGRPETSCPDPTCRRSREVGSLRPFAIFAESHERAKEVWGKYGNPIAIYEICPDCFAIRVTNQDT